MEMHEHIDGKSKVIVLLGTPVGHSLSPAMHNLSFEYNGTNAVYVACDITAADVPEVIAGFKHAGILGCNVTMPCKRAVIPYLDELSPEAEIMQTVNVIHFCDGKAKGYNTDGPGYVEVLRKAGVDIPNATITVLGPGGAGAPIIVSNALEGMKKIHVFARKGGPSYLATEEMMGKLAEKAPKSEVLLHDFADVEAMRAAIQESDVLINCTNVGMGEGCTDVPIDPDLIKPGMIVGDAIYFPRVTQFMKEAQARGCETLDGLSLLLEQAAIGERIWLDIEMPTDLVAEKIFGR